MIVTRIVLLFLFMCNSVLAQGGVLQGGAVVPGHSATWSLNGLLTDGGSAAPSPRGRQGTGLGLQLTGQSSPPYAATGDGPFGTNLCDYDGPVTGPYHFVCIGPNAQGGQIIATGAANGAAPMPLVCNINGVLTPCVGSINGLLAVSNLSAMKALAVGVYSTVFRAGYVVAGDGGAGYYNFSGSSCSLNSGAGDNGSQVAPNVGVGCWLLDPSVPSNVKIWGAVGDRVTDDTASLQAALNFRAAAGGGTVLLGRAGYLVDTATLVVPTGVTLACDGGFIGENYPSQNWQAVPCSLIVNPAYTVLASAHSTIHDVVEVRKGLTAMSSMRTAVQQIALFSGIGVTVGGIDVHLSRVMFVGFDTCIADSGYERLIATDSDGDCNNGISLDNSHDISTFTRLHFWDFAVGHPTGNWGNNGTYAVTGFANNGSGNIRVTFTPGAEAPVTGDLVAFSNMLGLPYNVRQRVTVTVVDNTHMDLPIAYPSAPAVVSGTTVTGSNVISNVSSAIGLGPGMTLASNGAFTSGGTILNMTLLPGSPGMVNVTMSANAATTVTSGGVFSFSALSQSGGVGYIDLTYRPGKGFSWTNGERNSCDHCFEFGHKIGFYVGPNALWTDLTSPASDMLEHEDSSAFSYVFDVGSGNSMVSNIWASGHGHALYVVSSGGPAHTINGGSFNQAAAGVLTPTLQFVSGSVSLVGTSLGALVLPGTPLGDPSILIGNTSSDKIILVGNDFKGVPINGQGAGSSARVIAAANNSVGGP